MKTILLTTPSFGHNYFRDQFNWTKVVEGTPTLIEDTYDLLIALGVGKLPPQVLAAADHALNLHGGDPEKYRGLDSHLWAILHEDFNAVRTTLHYMTNQYDAGEIVFSLPVPLPPSLDELYMANMRVCVDLVRNARTYLTQHDTLPHRPQQAQGHYYSTMPLELRTQCRVKYQQHVTPTT